MAIVNPLDLHEIFVNLISGNLTIFLFMAIIVMTIVAAKFRMTNTIFGMLLTLFGVFMATWIPWFYALIVVVGGFAIFFVIGRIIKQ